MHVENLCISDSLAPDDNGNLVSGGNANRLAAITEHLFRRPISLAERIGVCRPFNAERLIAPTENTRAAMASTIVISIKVKPA
jgi:hypothetical protein